MRPVNINVPLGTLHQTDTLKVELVSRIRWHHGNLRAVAGSQTTAIATAFIESLENIRIVVRSANYPQGYLLTWA